MGTEESTEQHNGTVCFINWSGYHWRRYQETTQEMIGGQYSRGYRTGSEENGTVFFINRIGFDRSTSEENTGDCTENERILVEATGSDWLFNLLIGVDWR